MFVYWISRACGSARPWLFGAAYIVSMVEEVRDDAAAAASAAADDAATDAARIARVVRGKRVLAVTGAGISTGSGLPDYRGQGSTEEPSIEFDMFMRDPVWRRWVWQRNHETWRAMTALSPTPGHIALAQMEARGQLLGVATQNIDGLHTKAGSVKVAELHGSFRAARCLSCGERISRERLADELERLNPDWPEDPDPAHVAVLATARRAEAEASTFVVAPCPICGGILKPDVVFFGEGLPAEAMDWALSTAREAEVVLVVGTSLVVSTGMWVVRQALANDADLVVINHGPTAIDGWPCVRSYEDASAVLSRVAQLVNTTD